MITALSHGRDGALRRPRRASVSSASLPESPALQALRDGQHLGAFRQACKSVALESRVEQLEHRLSELQKHLERFYPQSEPVNELRVLAQIKSLVATHYAVSIPSLSSPTRWADAVWARNVAMYLAVVSVGIAKRRVGKEFNRCYSAVRVAVRNVADEIFCQTARAQEFQAFAKTVEAALKDSALA